MYYERLYDDDVKLVVGEVTRRDETSKELLYLYFG